MNKEQKFYQMLKDIFVGVKVEGKGGFVNLMKIKSNYYNKIEEILKADVERAIKNYPDFKEELFDKLYNFFSRYFSDNGAIYFLSTPLHNNVYEKVYTDEKDIILFWKTHMLYYVKSEKIFRTLEVELEGLKFLFDVSNLELKKANERKDLVFDLKEVKTDKTIVFSVSYSEKGRVTKIDDILKKLKQNGFNVSEETLEKAFRVFEGQNELDFFINKNAKEFLEEQFKLWIYQYFWDGSKEWSADRVNQLQILKDLAFKIIDFVAQFENELVKIWNKPKFVKNSNYVITFDRFNNIELIEKILKHPNITEQIKEWKELKIVDDDFNVEEVIKKKTSFENHSIIKKLNEKYKFLPIDTKYFKDLEIEILSQFDNLDEALDGWLIKSENYQALNTLLPKFKGKIQTIYIDPPFNLSSSDKFLYRTNYKDSTWATLLENRLSLAKNWLNEKGNIFVRCDYNGNWIVRALMNELFGDENFKNEIIVNRFARMKSKGKRFPAWHDTIFFYTMSEESYFEHLTEEKEGGEQWDDLVVGYDTKGWWVVPDDMLDKFSKENLKLNDKGQYVTRARIILGKEVLPSRAGRFPPQEKIFQLEKEGRIRFNEKGKPEMLYPKFLYLTDNWSDIYGYTCVWDFPTENSEILLKRVLECSSKENDYVLDFFLGSGTTVATAQKLGRKWIGVEMGEHFYTLVLPRMKKVLAYDGTGISKEKDVKERYNRHKAGGFFKYYELEQYEETLANTSYEECNLSINSDKSPFEQYVFLKDEKMLKALEIDYENNKVKIDLTKLYSNIDIAETISNLTGNWIKQIRDDEVEYADGTVVNLKDLDFRIIKPLIWWE